MKAVMLCIDYRIVNENTFVAYFQVPSFETETSLRGNALVALLLLPFPLNKPLKSLLGLKRLLNKCWICVSDYREVWERKENIRSVDPVYQFCMGKFEWSRKPETS